MTLKPGCRFMAAPHFRLPADWSSRLLIGAGVEEADGCFYPRHAWRSPTADEFSLLAPASEEPMPAEELEAGVCLFQLPGHLRSQLWARLEQAVDVLGDKPLPGFDSFVNQVSEFLAFKSLPLPESARCELVVSNPGQRSATSRPAGLRCNLAPSAPWPLTDEQYTLRLWGAINLGEENTSVVLLNLPCQQLAAELRLRFADQPSPALVGELAERFLRACPDYPPVRLILGPGEGYRLPRGGLLLDSYLADKQEPDLMLSISCGVAPQATSH